jgi:hypothetical protein
MKFLGIIGVGFNITDQLVIMKNGVFWDVTPRGSCNNRRFGGMSVFPKATWHNILEDGILHSHYRENLKSYNY